MGSKIVFQTNTLGFFVGVATADESPLEPGIFHIPAGCVEMPPPACTDKEIARWVSGAWLKEKLPEAPTPEEKPLTKEAVEHARLLAYSDPIYGSDRLFAEASRMQLMEEEGFEAVRASAIARYREIQALYPWPEEEEE